MYVSTQLGAGRFFWARVPVKGLYEGHKCTWTIILSNNALMCSCESATKLMLS